MLAGVVEDGGAQSVRVKATAAAAVGSDTTITVNVGDGGTAVLAVCTGSGQSRSCTGDYERGRGNGGCDDFRSGHTSGTADVTVTPVSDTVAEGGEVIRFTGSASGFGVIPADLRILRAGRVDGGRVVGGRVGGQRRGGHGYGGFYGRNQLDVDVGDDGDVVVRGGRERGGGGFRCAGLGGDGEHPGRFYQQLGDGVDGFADHRGYDRGGADEKIDISGVGVRVCGGGGGVDGCR